MAYRIVIDPGHGGSDWGASYEGRKEKDDNLNLALAVGRILQNNGVDIEYTRTDDVYNTPLEKAMMGNNADADFFISFHRNATGVPEKSTGIETLVFQDSGIKAEMARNINREMANLGFEDRGVIERPNLVVLKRTKMPALLIEAGFIDNEKDNAKFDAEFDQIAEAIAMSDDELMEKYFSGEEFSEAELTRGVRLGVRNGEIRPVYSGSATHSVGIERLMDLIVKYFPTYGEAGSVMVTDAESNEPVMLETNEKETLCAQVFKTVVDPFVGRISYIKVLTGVMSSDSVVYNATKEQNEKISTIFIVKGKHQTAVGKLFTGDIGAVVKLQVTQTNDTLCEKGKHYLVDPIKFSEPMLAMAVFPNSKNDEDKMSNALARMVEEDPTLRLENNKETKQTVLYGIGDQHIDVVLNKLKNKYKVEVRLETPKVPYHETIRKTAVGEGRHKKQSGGHGQFGHVFVEFSPNPDEEEMVFEEKVFGGAVPRQYFPAVETGLRECMQHGLLAGYKVVNIKATLLDGKYHDVDSSEMAFKLAARLSYKAGIPEAKPILLEPIMNVTVKVPDEFTGTIIGDFNKRRGAIMGMDMVDGYQEITAQVPLAEIQKYPIELRAMTQGRGVYSQSFDRYEPVPSNIADGIIAQHKKETEE